MEHEMDVMFATEKAYMLIFMEEKIQAAPAQGRQADPCAKVVCARAQQQAGR